MMKRDKRNGRFGDTYQKSELLAKHFAAKFNEQVERITDVAEDVTFAHELMTSDDFEFERNTLWEVFDSCQKKDGKVSPKALCTDYKRAIREPYHESDGIINAPVDVRCFLGRYANDHTMTAIICFLVADDPEVFREYVQLNHADCDIVLCCMFPNTFKWLYEERINEPCEDKQASPWWVLKQKFDSEQQQIPFDFDYDSID